MVFPIVSSQSQMQCCFLSARIVCPKGHGLHQVQCMATDVLSGFHHFTHPQQMHYAAMNHYFSYSLQLAQGFWFICRI